MHRKFVVACSAVMLLLAAARARADRPNEKRENATHVVSGTVRAVFVQETKGYRNFIVEIKVDEVTKGEGLKKGDIFRAFCYQRKPGVDAMAFDTAGHNLVPQQGQRVWVYVNSSRGHNEGVYPNWVDVLDKTKK